MFGASRRSKERAGVRSSPAVLVALLAMACGAVFGEETEAPARGQTRKATINPEYAAGGFHRWLWGSDYRGLWTAPFEIEVLDLQSFAGGLTPVRRVGGQQTKGLAMKGKDGRDYTFRSIDKDPTEILPEDLRDTWVKNVVVDQMSAQHPASPLVADELMKAAGILRTEQRFFVMPDDPALGEYRKDFAGVVGTVYEFVGAKSDENPGFQDATEVLKHEEFYARLLAGPAARADARAFLKARLFDIFIGDWDRHRDQWRWLKLPGQEQWQPMPDDRDQALSRYEGLVLGLVRARAVILQNFRDHYPGMKGLTWNGWEQDRELLAGLERPVFKQVAAELQAALTDEVIQRAAHRMPPEYFKVDGERLIHDLKGRRDRLVEAAEAFYEHIADKVKVWLTDQPEYVEVKWQDDGDGLVQVWRQGPDGKPAADPFYHRTLHKGETREVQIYLRGGDDRVVTLGKPGGVELRVIGGPGHDVVDDTNGGGTHLYDAGELKKGPDSRLDTKPYTRPPPPKNAPWIPPRDWGRDSFWVPWVNYGSDLGVFTGLGLDTQAHAFRKDPNANRQIIRAGWSWGDSTYRADYKGVFRFENSRLSMGLFAYASGIESSRFFGFGNETSDGGDSGSDFFRVRDQQFRLVPTINFKLARNLVFLVGPSLTYTTTTKKDKETLINQEQPYGYGDFGEVGAVGLLQLDTRVSASKAPGGVALRSLGYTRSGVLVNVVGDVVPKAWDVEETFGAVKGSAAAFLTPGGDRAPTLALRAGGKKTFGKYPFFEAAYVGGGSGAFDNLTADALVRGLQKHRYAGDSSLYGNADLRIYISRLRLILPGTWGVFGYGDAGRVYLEGDDSDKWHYGYGGGIWVAWLDRSNTLSFSWAHAEGRNAVYFRAGFNF